MRLLFLPRRATPCAVLVGWLVPVWPWDGIMPVQVVFADRVVSRWQPVPGALRAEKLLMVYGPGGLGAGLAEPPFRQRAWIRGGAGVTQQAQSAGEALAGGGPGGPLTGRVAIVTGAAGGLGSTTVRALHDAGAAVVPVDVHGDDCLIADVSTAGGNRAMVEAALGRHGRLDILV